MQKMTMFLRLIKGAITKRKSRVIIYLLAIALGASVISAMVSFYYDIGIKMRKELRTYGPNVVIGPTENTTNIAPSNLKKVLATLPSDKLLGYVPYTYGVAKSGEHRLVAVGTDFSGVKKVSPYWHIQGEWPGKNGALLGIDAAEKLNVNPGDELKLISEENKKFLKIKVTGLVKTGGAEDSQIFMEMDQAWEFFGKNHGIDVVYASIIGDASWVENWIDKVSNPKLQIQTIKKISQAEGKVVERIRALVYLIVTVILGSTLLCVTTTTMAMIMERRQEIALKKALGAQNSAVALEVMGESTIMGLLGGILGWLVGLILAQGIGYSVFGSWVSFRWQVIPLVLFSSVLLSNLACILPVKKALSIQPAVTLKGE